MVVVRTDAPIIDPAWVVSDVGLEDLVLAYMAGTPTPPAPTPLAAVRS
jgi:ABC-2 type transport system ATP-binding protein